MEHEYLKLLQDVLDNGAQKGDRTGTGTLSVFGRQIRHDLSHGFPLLTTKKIHFKAIVHELLWFISGDTNVKYLQDNGVKIWDEWANDAGELGPVYGKQWRDFGGRDDIPIEGIDQLTEVIQRIKDKPNDRRLIISAWNPMDVPKMALPPCHCFMQFYVSNGKLSCQMYQRSADMFLGVPFNIASYALLTMMIAQVTGLQPGEFIHTFGDTHIYNNHIDQVKLQLSRRPYLLPIVKLNPNVKNIEDFKYEDIELTHYISHDSIKAKVAV